MYDTKKIDTITKLCQIDLAMNATSIRNLFDLQSEWPAALEQVLKGLTDSDSIKQVISKDNNSWSVYIMPMWGNLSHPIVISDNGNLITYTHGGKDKFINNEWVYSEEE